MGWFNRAEHDADTAQLQAALRVVLTHLSEKADPRVQVRITRVLARLERPPVPSGLTRELSTILANASGADEFDDLPILVGGMTSALASALAQSALLDEALQTEIRELQEFVPRRVGKGDAKHVHRRADKIAEVAGPARQRAVAVRKEVRALVTGVGAELAPAHRSVAALDWGLTELSGSIAGAAEPGAFLQIHEGLLTMAKELQEQAGALRQQLRKAQEQVSELENNLAEQEASLEEAREAAERDPLTQLYNRGVFDRGLLRSVRESEDSAEVLSLAVLDVDHFKLVNDVHGHPVGDQVLTRVAALLQAAVRSDDLAARIGGEEFAIVLPGSSPEAASEVVERVRAAVEAEIFDSGDAEFSVTLSAGVATLVPEESAAGLLKRADEALYAAKQAGRNQAVLAA